MSYKFTTGSVRRDDIYYEQDPEQNTYIDWNQDSIGFVAGGQTLLTVSTAAGVSGSVNVSASSFYGDGSNLSNVAGGGAPTDAAYVTLATDGDLSAERVLTAGDGIGLTDGGAGSTITITNPAMIHAPWLSGSTDTYQADFSGNTLLNLDGYNFASGIITSFDAQFTTDGHTSGSTTWNSPVFAEAAVTASSTTGSYDIIVTNTDGQAFTITDGLGVVAGPYEITLDSSDQYTDYNNTTFDTIGDRTGLYKDAGGIAWNGGAITTAQITTGETEAGQDLAAYLEYKPSVTGQSQNPGWYFMLGFGYVDDAATDAGFAWIDWALYCNNASTAVYESGASKYAGASVYWTDERTWRVEVDNDEVTYKYSDNDGGSWTTIYTSLTAVDVGANSNLVGGFAFYSPEGASNTAILEDVKLFGALTNVPG